MDLAAPPPPPTGSHPEGGPPSSGGGLEGGDVVDPDKTTLLDGLKSGPGHDDDGVRSLLKFSIQNILQVRELKPLLCLLQYFC